MSRPVADYCWACDTEFLRHEGHVCSGRAGVVPAPYVIHTDGRSTPQIPDSGYFPIACDDPDCQLCQ